MSIYQGWCIEAICDRCQYSTALAYSDKLDAREVAARAGWEVGLRTLCPRCKRIAELNRERGRRGRPWRK